MKIAGWAVFVSVLLSPALWAGELFTHAPILIASDADFTPENGVVGGSGAPDDPYVIAGWRFEVRQGFGIRIQGTTAAFVVRDCLFLGTGKSGTGVLLREVSGGRVQGCAFSGLGAGIVVYKSPLVRIEGGDFLSCREGVSGTESEEVAVAGCTFSGAVKNGVFLWRCHRATIAGSSFSECRSGIYLDSCHGCVVKGNVVQGADRGIFLWDSFNCTVTGNLLQGCALGIALVHTAAGNLVFHNAFLGCQRSATCDELDNRWDGGYPVGGNYWQGVELEDVRSGPRQELPGPDGIGDNPVEVPFGNVDRYPLTEPPEELGGSGERQRGGNT